MSKSQIPMLSAYSEHFKVSGPRAIKDRKGRIFMEICQPKIVTRKQLAADFEVRPGTISDLVLQLIDQGLVVEARPTSPHQKGRPEILLHPVMSRLGVIVFHVVSQTVHATLVDLGGNELCNSMQDVQADHISNDDLERLFIGMAEKLRTLAPEETEIVGVSFSLPGIIDQSRKTWVFATSRWPQIQNMDLSSIEEHLGLNIVVNKNLNCELLARIVRREESPNSNILFIHWGHGIGASCSLSGTTLVSGNGGFGEIGHTYTHNEVDVQCRCGLNNCLETQAAIWALLPKLRKKYQDIPVDEWLFEDFLTKNENFDLSLLDNAVRAMAIAMRNLTLILSPHQIVLTGPFVQHPKIFAQLCTDFRKLLPLESHVFAHSNVSVAAARAGAEDEIIGATYPLFVNALKKLCR